MSSFNGKSLCKEDDWASSYRYVFTLIQHNLVVTVLFMVNSGHMVHGHTLGRTTILASWNFSQ